MKQPKIKHKPNNLPYITPFSKSAQKVESMRWSVGIEAYVIHPSWPKNAIKLCKKYNTWIHQIWNYKWFNPVHLKITWILNILTIIEKHEITLGKIIWSWYDNHAMIFGSIFPPRHENRWKTWIPTIAYITPHVL